MQFLILSKNHQENFHTIIIFCFSKTDEPLYAYLQEKLPEVELINNIEEVPLVQDFDDNEKHKSKLIEFDDFIGLNTKQMKILIDYAISSRKFGFTCIFVSQNYTSIPKCISRNYNYIFYLKFKLMIKSV